MRTHEFSGYHTQLSSLAYKGLKAHLPKTDSSHDASSKQRPCTITIATSAAMLLLVSDVSLHEDLHQGLMALGKTTTLLTDPAGHRRPIYLPLAFHLHLTAWQRHIKEPLPAGAHELASRMKARLDDADADIEIDVALWELLCLYQMSMMTADEPLWKDVTGRLETLLATQGEDGSLHMQDPNDSLDAWTYRELVGLHAIYNLAQLMEDEKLKKRCDEIARYHLDNTQPDNTTNQPWGIAAFLADANTASMGVQQMHDATAQGSNSASQNVGLVAAMLLADAANVLVKNISKNT